MSSEDWKLVGDAEFGSSSESESGGEGDAASEARESETAQQAHSGDDEGGAAGCKLPAEEDFSPSAINKFLELNIFPEELSSPVKPPHQSPKQQQHFTDFTAIPEPAKQQANGPPPATAADSKAPAPADAPSPAAATADKDTPNQQQQQQPVSHTTAATDSPIDLFAVAKLFTFYAALFLLFSTAVFVTALFLTPVLLTVKQGISAAPTHIPAPHVTHTACSSTPPSYAPSASHLEDYVEHLMQLVARKDMELAQKGNVINALLAATAHVTHTPKAPTTTTAEQEPRQASSTNSHKAAEGAQTPVPQQSDPQPSTPSPEQDSTPVPPVADNHSQQATTASSVDASADASAASSDAGVMKGEKHSSDTTAAPASAAVGASAALAIKEVAPRLGASLHRTFSRLNPSALSLRKHSTNAASAVGASARATALSVQNHHAAFTHSVAKLASSVKRAGHACAVRTLQAGSSVKAFAGAQAVAVYQGTVSFVERIISGVRCVRQAVHGMRTAVNERRHKIKVRSRKKIHAVLLRANSFWQGKQAWLHKRSATNTQSEQQQEKPSQAQQKRPSVAAGAAALTSRVHAQLQAIAGRLPNWRR